MRFQILFPLISTNIYNPNKIYSDLGNPNTTCTHIHRCLLEAWDNEIDWPIWSFLILAKTLSHSSLITNNSSWSDKDGPPLPLPEPLIEFSREEGNMSTLMCTVEILISEW